MRTLAKETIKTRVFFFFSSFFFFCCCFCSSVLHTVWKLLANNGSIIFRIVTKQDLLVQRIITPNSLPLPPPRKYLPIAARHLGLYSQLYSRNTCILRLIPCNKLPEQTKLASGALDNSDKQTNKQTFSAFLKWNRNKSILFYRSANLPINEEEKAESCTYSNSQPTAESWEFENTKALLTIQPFCASTLAAV